MPSLPLRPSPARPAHCRGTPRDPTGHAIHKFGPQKVAVFWARAKVISEIVQNVEKFTQSSQLKKANLDEFLSFFVKSFLPTVG